MSFTKITEDDKRGKTNVGQPDTPGLTTAEMQELLDALPNLAIDGINRLVDELAATNAAANIGAEVPAGIQANENVQSILNNMVLTLSQCNAARHTHSNKETLDAITDLVKDTYDRLVLLFENIEQIQDSISSTTNAIPSSAAVVAYIENYNYSRKVAQSAYPIGSVFSTVSTLDPASILGIGTWRPLGVDAEGVKRYIREA